MDLSYPIGKFDFKQTVDQRRHSRADRRYCRAAGAIARWPRDGLGIDQLDTPYRPGGWTVRQTVHHVADSHMNSYIRLRLALTETEPADPSL